MKSSSRREDHIQIGKIVAAHGIRGVVKVFSYAESTQCYTDQEDLLLIDPSGCEHHHTVQWVKPHQNSFRMALKDIITRTQAEALVGCTIWIARKSLPPLEDDTYYWVDLIGLAVYGADGEYLGRIAEIIETGANDVYVVKTPQGCQVDEILLPAIASVIIEVNLPEKRMEVNVPEGLI